MYYLQCTLVHTTQAVLARGPHFAHAGFPGAEAHIPPRPSQKASTSEHSACDMHSVVVAYAVFRTFPLWPLTPALSPAGKGCRRHSNREDSTPREWRHQATSSGAGSHAQTRAGRAIRTLTHATLHLQRPLDETAGQHRALALALKRPLLASRSRAPLRLAPNQTRASAGAHAPRRSHALDSCARVRAASHHWRRVIYAHPSGQRRSSQLTTCLLASPLRSNYRPPSQTGFFALLCLSVCLFVCHNLAEFACNTYLK